MTQTALPMSVYTRYFEAGKLGTLSFPNGRSYYNDCFTNLLIHLSDLYKMATSWKIDSSKIDIENVMAILAFGSAVKKPSEETVRYTRKKYFFFGKEVTRIRTRTHSPSDIDFLVVTKNNLIREEYLQPKYHHFYDISCVGKGGIHITTRGIEQLINIKANDSVSLSALREGVVLFSDCDLMPLRSTIDPSIQRHVYWDQDEEGRLVGKIK